MTANLTPDSAPSALLGSARGLADGRLELRVANRDSIQARLGGRHWAALDRERPLYPTPDSLRRLAGAAGLTIQEVRFPRTRQAQRWIWQTLLNAFTFNENLVSDLRAGRLDARDRPVRFAIDVLVTALAAIPLAFISVPLELMASLTGRGGELVAIASRARSTPARESPPPAPVDRRRAGAGRR
jgi:hypothetical protein